MTRAAYNRESAFKNVCFVTDGKRVAIKLQAAAAADLDVCLVTKRQPGVEAAGQAGVAL